MLISIIIPVYNEEGSIDNLCKELSKFLEENSINYEIIFINDGSIDKSLSIIKKICENSKKVKYINFSRNFGKEAATSAGLHACNGDAAIMIDADGQHPKELIPIFIKNWQKGSKVVVGIRTSNVNEGFIKKYGSKMFYKILNSINDGHTVPGSTDFRLLDRSVINEFNKFSEHNRITRGLIDWLGFKSTYVQFKANERKTGIASYSYKKLVKLAIHSFVSQSTKPLLLTGYAGLFVTIVSAVIGIMLIINKFVFNDPMHLYISGTGFLAIFISFLLGVVLVCQGLLALYIESIHSESLNRPIYVIEDSNI